ncbi:chemotaxis protein CheD [Cereibacter sphaeroides]|nr:chemotaxis protein CheD [Cereibacter sphaeroides]
MTRCADRPSASQISITHVTQGSCVASASPNEVYATILGSCICTCMCDPVAGVGGMNHFLLPSSEVEDAQHLRYGSHAMELLINALLKLGAARQRIEAKIFGGAMMTPQLGAIGQANAAFARRYLRDEGILCTAQSLGGNRARRIRFWPKTGRVQQMFLGSEDVVPTEQPQVRLQGGAGDVTFFDRHSNAEMPDPIKEPR